MHRVLGKKLLELRVELSGQRFIVRNDQCGALHLLNDVRHRERFATARHPHEDLLAFTRFQPLCQRFNRCWLVAGRRELRLQLKRNLSQVGVFDHEIPA